MFSSAMWKRPASSETAPPKSGDLSPASPERERSGSRMRAASASRMFGAAGLKLLFGRDVEVEGVQEARGLPSTIRTRAETPPDHAPSVLSSAAVSGWGAPTSCANAERDSDTRS